MVQPVFAEFPPAPSRSDAPVDFSAKADTFVAALPPFALKMNQAIAWMVESMTAISASESAAAASATQAALAASTATQARDAAQLAVTQATANGAAQVALATAAAQTAQIAAAASGASAGIGQLGNPGDSLQVNAARTGLVFGPSDGKVGDVLISARNPGPLFVPANGGIRAQSALPSLLGVLGLLGGQVGQQYATLSAGTTTTVIDVASAPNPNGGAPLVMQITKGSGVSGANFSSDGGATWNAKSTPNGVYPVSISYDETNSLWLISYSNESQISYSSDNGGTWLLTPSGGVLPTGVSKIVADANGVWIATSYATAASVYRSTDKGVTWTAISTGASAIHTAISTDNKGVWCVTAGSTVRRSVDGGLTWAVQFTASSTQNAISNDRNGVWLISGLTSNSNTYKSADNGLTWTLLATPVTSTVTDIAYSQGFFFLVRNVSPQLIMISSAADATVYTVPTAAVLASLIKVTATAGYVVAVNSANTTVLRSAPIFAYDTSSQFQLPNFPLATGLQAWIKAGLAMLSSGKSFTSGSIIGVSPGTLLGMDTDGNGVIIAVGSSTIRRSTDYGATWATVTNPAGTTLFSIATDKKGLWIIGGNNTILRSTDNGKTFTIVTSSNHGFSGYPIGQVVIGKDGIMVGCTVSTAVPPRKSVDGGLNWTNITGIASIAPARAATDGLGRWLIAQGASAFTSTDNGITFGTAITTGVMGTVASVIITDNGSALITGSTTTARYSGNYGGGWSSDVPMPLASMNLLRGPGESVLGFSAGGSRPYVAGRLPSNFVASTILGTAPTAIVSAAGGKDVPFIMAGVVSTDRVLYSGILDTPV